MVPYRFLHLLPEVYQNCRRVQVAQPHHQTPAQFLAVALVLSAWDHHSAEHTSNLSLLAKLEQWGINKDSKVSSVQLTTEQLTGAQLEGLLKNLPDGITYSLDLNKE